MTVMDENEPMNSSDLSVGPVSSIDEEASPVIDDLASELKDDKKATGIYSEALFDDEQANTGMSTILHTDYEDNRSNTECCLFIGNLSKFCTEDGLRDNFSSYGVRAAIIKRTNTSHTPLGYGFLTLESNVHGQACINDWNGREWNGRSLNISFAQNKSDLVIKNLDQNITEDQLYGFFESFGTINKAHTSIEYGDTSASATIQFQSRDSAVNAKRVMNNSKMNDRILIVEWTPKTKAAEYKPIEDNNNTDSTTVDESAVNEIPVTSVHFRFEGIAGEIVDESRVRTAFNTFGSVVDVVIKIVKLRKNGRPIGYGFVHFENTEAGNKSAQLSVECLGEWAVLQNVAYKVELSQKTLKAQSIRVGSSPVSAPVLVPSTSFRSIHVRNNIVGEEMIDSESTIVDSMPTTTTTTSTHQEHIVDDSKNNNITLSTVNCYNDSNIPLSGTTSPIVSYGMRQYGAPYHPQLQHPPYGYMMSSPYHYGNYDHSYVNEISHTGMYPQLQLHPSVRQQMHHTDANQGQQMHHIHHQHHYQYHHNNSYHHNDGRMTYSPNQVNHNLRQLHNHRQVQHQREHQHQHQRHVRYNYQQGDQVNSYDQVQHQHKHQTGNSQLNGGFKR
eukprot:gene5603-11306_t